MHASKYSRSVYLLTSECTVHIQCMYAKRRICFDLFLMYSAAIIIIINFFVFFPSKDPVTIKFLVSEDIDVHFEFAVMGEILSEKFQVSSTTCKRIHADTHVHVDKTRLTGSLTCLTGLSISFLRIILRVSHVHDLNAHISLFGIQFFFRFCYYFFLLIFFTDCAGWTDITSSLYTDCV